LSLFLAVLVVEIAVDAPVSVAGASIFLVVVSVKEEVVGLVTALKIVEVIKS
jgi:hypothetical protein